MPVTNLNPSPIIDFDNISILNHIKIMSPSDTLVLLSPNLSNNNKNSTKKKQKTK